MTTPVHRLDRAIHGWISEWSYDEGLDPATVAEALAVDISPGPVRLGGRARRGAMVTPPGLTQPVWFVWEDDGELALVEITEPTLQPDAETALEALGPPDEVIEFGGGPHPGSEQQVHLTRGVTVFDGFNHGITHVWLFRPTDLHGYEVGLEATQTPRRSHPPRSGGTQ